MNIHPITYDLNGLEISANVYTPAGYDASKTYPAIVVAHPNGGVKEQVAGLYSQRLADAGYLCLAFDAAGQGASEGEPRNIFAEILESVDRKTIQDATFPKCPIRNILARIGDKWTMLVLYALENNGTMRFNDLCRVIPDISQKMLTASLKVLVEDGLVSRKLYPSVPPKVEYALTEMGRSLLPHLNSLIGWAIEHFDSIMKNRQGNN